MSYFREFQEAYHLMLEAGVTFERQENEFVLAINNAVIENSDQPITIKTKDATIKKVNSKTLGKISHKRITLNPTNIYKI